MRCGGPLHPPPPNEQEEQEEQKEGFFSPSEEFNLQWGHWHVFLINEKGQCLFGVTMYPYHSTRVTTIQYSSRYDQLTVSHALRFTRKR
jgi:hypothetical protein